jgi:hypothetical protein
MRHYYISTLLISLFLLSFTPNSQENEWELKKEADGIRVYTRDVKGSNIKEFKASSKLTSSQETILNILFDIPNYPKWIEDVEDARILSKNEKEMNFYYQLNLPWPLKDRDIAMSMKISPQEDASVLLDLLGRDDLIEEGDDFIRMNNVVGKWLIRPIDDKNCEVTYQFLADPEGSLPAWVINLFIVDGPHQTLLNLEEYAASKSGL